MQLRFPFLGEACLEAFHAAGGINHLGLASVEGMAA